ncbi:MAG: hypothetical protein IPM46_06270 [Flavobacteriales bacterium]|nr:hypothetical protein [Flavobacteriales bacterium]
MGRPSLLQEISELTYLKEAWSKLNKANEKSRGLSYETIKHFGDQLDANIKQISKELRDGTYKFQKPRGVLIKKADKRDDRPLRVQDVRDRVVAKAISLRLDKELTPKFKLNNPCSFAYRENRGVQQAIVRMVDLYKNGRAIILEADIEKFFDKVDRPKLLRDLATELPDSSLSGLIESALNQEVGNLDEFAPESHHYFNASMDGIPQGNSLSPLLSNVCLAQFDQRMQDEGLGLVRYADDFIVMCKNRKEAERAFVIAKEEIEDGLDLRIYPMHDPSLDQKKFSQIVDPRRQPFHFLSIGFSGHELWVHEKKIVALKGKLRDALQVTEEATLLKNFMRVKNILEGWLASFKFVPVEKRAKDIDDFLNVHLCTFMRKSGMPIRSSHTPTIRFDGKDVESLTPPQRRATGIRTCTAFLKTIKDRGIVEV